MVSSLKEHIIDVEVEIENFNEKFSNDWAIDTSLTAIQTETKIKKIHKRVIKKALPLINFQFLVEFTSICKYSVTAEIRLLDCNGYLVDKLCYDSDLNVV